MNYREEVLRTRASTKLVHGDIGAMINGALGLAGESGEVVDLIKKIVYHDKNIELDKIVKELGDVRWYFESLLIAFGITMDQVEHANVAKLRARFPDGFTTDAANAKADEK